MVSPLPAGTIVGTYKILELLAEGGMGRIYAAEHTRLGRRVALKMLRPEYATNQVAIARFFAEAHAVNRIAHDNIIEITDFFEEPGGDYYYIMELLRGVDLAQEIVKLGVLPVWRAVGICAQVASALSAVHAAGIIHRDLKPDNIFLVERHGWRDYVKLIDFGVAKLTDVDSHTVQVGTTGQGTIVGTPEYMSPEQAAGQAVDQRTDIYALGVILYELVTGKLPFRGSNFGEYVVQHMTVAPTPPSRIDSLPHEIPPALDALILQLLAKNPNVRPATMAVVEERLHAIYEEVAPPIPEPTDRRSGQFATAQTASGSFPVVRPRSETSRPYLREATGPIRVRSDTRQPTPSQPTPSVPTTPTPPQPPVRTTPPPQPAPSVYEAALAALVEPVDDGPGSVPIELVPLVDELQPKPREIVIEADEPPPTERLSRVELAVEPPGPVVPEVVEHRRAPSLKPIVDPEVSRRPRTPSVIPVAPGRGSRVLAALAVLAIAAGGVWLAMNDPSPLVLSPPDGQPLKIAVPVVKPPPLPPPPAAVVIRFASTPSGATVRVAGRDEVLGTTPFEARFPRGAATTFTFDLDGHISALQQVAMAADGEVNVDLPEMPPPIVVTEPPAKKPPAKKHK